MENGKQSAFGFGFTTADGSSHVLENGLTKREYFAGLFMQGFITALSKEQFDSKALSVESIRIADELLKALEE